jgi:hypothetical protein
VPGNEKKSCIQAGILENVTSFGQAGGNIGILVLVNSCTPSFFITFQKVW